MKNIFLVLSALMISGFALGLEPPQPLLKFESHSGFVPPAMRFSRQCFVFNNSVNTIVTKATGGPVNQTKHIQFTPQVRSVRDITVLVETARRGKLVKSTAPTDGNSIHYQGFQVGGTAPVELKEYYSGFRQENTSPATAKLVSFLDLNCK